MHIRTSAIAVAVLAFAIGPPVSAADHCDKAAVSNIADVSATLGVSADMNIAPAAAIEEVPSIAATNTHPVIHLAALPIHIDPGRAIVIDENIDDYTNATMSLNGGGALPAVGLTYDDEAIAAASKTMTYPHDDASAAVNSATTNTVSRISGDRVDPIAGARSGLNLNLNRGAFEARQ